MGQVLTFPTRKVASESAKAKLETCVSDDANNVVLFDGVFVEYHEKPDVCERVGAKSWISDLDTTPRQGQR
ncbi:MAG: hypothetical protein ABJO09_07165 [Hyphomicrobiales bacterium]